MPFLSPRDLSGLSPLLKMSSLTCAAAPPPSIIIYREEGKLRPLEAITHAIFVSQRPKWTVSPFKDVVTHVCCCAIDYHLPRRRQTSAISSSLPRANALFLEKIPPLTIVRDLSPPLAGPAVRYCAVFLQNSFYKTTDPSITPLVYDTHTLISP
ncbi:hypothetical protein CDAR_595561 [Caerostris darwini]|uniref:Uncharacterized protein n=1 Tax=Caerostris darwini TaxID=1538125 RepID=A0AAV4P7F4_9ARAC|nr:hypothetical protein CDAR_595561 [Caerostris darwini]